MIISDGSHVVDVVQPMQMVRTRFNITITGDVIFFSESKKNVERYVDMELRNLKMPLPFGGQDGSIKVKINSINVKEV